MLMMAVNWPGTWWKWRDEIQMRQKQVFFGGGGVFSVSSHMHSFIWVLFNRGVLWEGEVTRPQTKGKL